MNDTTNSALIAEAKRVNSDLEDDVLGVRLEVIDMLTDALEAADARNAELDRVIAEKAWDEALAHAWQKHADAKGNVDNNAMLTAMFENPYRANPEPKEGE